MSMSAMLCLFDARHSGLRRSRVIVDKAFVNEAMRHDALTRDTMP